MKDSREITAKARRARRKIETISLRVLRVFAVKVIQLLLGAALLAGCRSAAQPAGTTPAASLPPPGISARTPVAATQAAAATETSIPAAATIPTTLPAATSPTATATENLLEMPLPEGTPAAGWQGIPVMPGAMAGEEQDGGYAYTIQAGVTDLQSFYETQMAGRGWMLARTGTSEQGAVILLFTRPPGAATAPAATPAIAGTAPPDRTPSPTYVTLTIIPQPEGFQLVLIVTAG